MMGNCRCTATPPNISGAIKHQIGTIWPGTRNKIGKHRPAIKPKETKDRQHCSTRKMFGTSSFFRRFLEKSRRHAAIKVDDVKTDIH